MRRQQLHDILEDFHDRYNRPGFIESDPISIPHSYSRKQDIEIMGLFAAVLAWGQRITTINKCRDLADRMDGEPYEFILSRSEKESRQLEGFVHRTFNDTDLIYFIEFLRHHYRESDTLEDAFLPAETDEIIFHGLSAFRDRFFSLPHVPSRTSKHIADPRKKSTCKRLNMYLRWMVRADKRGVDFGHWKRIPMSALMCPLDVHVERSARKLGLLTRNQRDWRAVEELTSNLCQLDPEDPVRFDFALFGMGLEESGRR